MGKTSDYPEISAKMGKTISVYEEDLKGYRVGRANPSVLDKLTVDYYGTATPIPQIGSVSVPDPRTLMIQPWDISLLKEVEKAIINSDLGITPSNDGKVIRLNFPPLTEDRRRDLVKKLSKRAEDAKIAIRAIRRDAVEVYKKKKKDSEITEDDLKDIEKGIQSLTDDYIKEIEQIFAAKEKEIMGM
jgi:ribosome recycling factor